MKTDDLIRQLAANAAPVRRLPAPWIQAMQWLLAALLAVAIVVFLVSPRPDLVTKLNETRFLVELGAAFATAVTAAMAAFCMATPGHGRKLALLPAIPLTIWLATLGAGCLQALFAFEQRGLRVEAEDWVCLPSIALVGAVPALLMVAMLRRRVPLAPRTTLMLGALAAAAIGDFGLRMFHPQDAQLPILIWQFGSVVLLSALAGWSGGFFLRWRHINPVPPQEPL